MLSIIICTHNPRVEILNLVLKSIEAQKGLEYEVIIVDNKSTQPLSELNSLFIGNYTRIVREEELGIPAARMRGIKESKYELISYVDDDTSLGEDYFLIGGKIANDYPNLGCFGGNSIGVFNIEVPKNAQPYLEMIGARKIDITRIGNDYVWYTTPAGGGTFVRSSIAKAYVEAVSKNPIRKILGKRGDIQGFSEDVDLAYTSIDLGFENGLFPELVIYHHIREKHLTKPYLILRKNLNVYCNALLEFARFDKIPQISSRSFFLKELFTLVKRGDLFEVRMYLAERNGFRKAIRFIKQYQR